MDDCWGSHLGVGGMEYSALEKKSANKIPSFESIVYAATTPSLDGV